MNSWLGSTVLLGTLAITAYRDCKEKSIYLYLPIVAGVMGVILHTFFLERGVADMLWGAGIGGCVILLAWISKESIGVGDGIMLMVSGIYLGFWENLELLFTALLLVGVTALFLMVVKKKRRDYRVPFLPFLLVAYLFQLI